MSGHRQNFCMNKFKKSALSMHAYDIHNGDISLSDFNVAVVKKVPPQET